MKTFTAKQLMTERLLTVRPSMDLRELVDFLRENRIHGTLVEDGDRLVGVVSYTDILGYLSDETLESSHGFSHLFLSDEEDDRLAPMLESLGSVKVRDVMTGSVVTCDEQRSAGDVASLMKDQSIHRVVITRNGKAVGLLSATDLLAAVTAYEDQLTGQATA